MLDADESPHIIDENPAPLDKGLAFGRKIAALGFIIVILAGNFWWVEYALSRKVHALVEWSFFIGLMIAMIGGAIILLRKVLLYFKHHSNQ